MPGGGESNLFGINAAADPPRLDNSEVGDNDDDEGDDEDDPVRARADACSKRLCRGDRPPRVRRGGSTSSSPFRFVMMFLPRWRKRENQVPC